MKRDCSVGAGSSLRVDANDLELDRGDDGTTLWMYEMPRNYALQNGFFFVMWNPHKEGKYEAEYDENHNERNKIKVSKEAQWREILDSSGNGSQEEGPEMGFKKGRKAEMTFAKYFISSLTKSRLETNR